MTASIWKPTFCVKYISSHAENLMIMLSSLGNATRMLKSKENLIVLDTIECYIKANVQIIELGVNQ